MLAGFRLERADRDQRGMAVKRGDRADDALSGRQSFLLGDVSKNS